MAVISNTVVLITLNDGKKIVSDEKYGMNVDEVDIRGSLESEGRVNVYHSYGGSTIVSERDVQSIKTISETINWVKTMEWIDTHDNEPNDFFMQSISGNLSFSHIKEYYENGFYLRDISTKENISLETARSYFRFENGKGSRQP